MFRNSESKDAVLRNAERLLSDARLLFEHGRFPSAATLAVQSIEEFGKAVFGMSAGHISKQRAAALRDYSEEVIDHVYESGFEIKRIAQLSDRQKAACEDEKHHAEVDEMLGEVVRSAEWRVVVAMSKELSDLKNSCLYVDLGQDESLLSEPSCIDRGDAKRVIEMASKLLQRYYADPVVHRRKGLSA
jgi:AbiV family abortive infection protein